MPRKASRRSNISTRQQKQPKQRKANARADITKRLLERGPASLTDVELVSLFWFTALSIVDHLKRVRNCYQSMVQFDSYCPQNRRLTRTILCRATTSRCYKLFWNSLNVTTARR